MSKNIKVKQYIDLVLKRDALQREQVVWGMEYFKEFGEQILENFQIEIECIKTKKALSFCQEKRNRFLPIIQSELDARINGLMQDYYEKLEDMSNLLDVEGTYIGEVEAIKIKKLYHNLAKKMHPDLNPDIANNEKLMRLWQEVVSAYRCNNYDKLLELSAIINNELDDEEEQEIENVDEKIAELLKEIEDIKSTNPYQYKYLLQDEGLKEEKRKELTEEKQELIEYLAELQEELDNYVIVKQEN